MYKKIFFMSTILLQMSCLTNYNSSLFGKDCECDFLECEEFFPECFEECPRGPRGHRGHSGDRGHNGNRGPTGHFGHRGIRGQRGPQGPRGEGFNPSFAFRYNPYLDHIEIPPSGNIPFAYENIAPSGPIIYNISTNEFIFGRSAYYEISYGISQGNANVTVGLFVNNTEVNGSRLYVDNSQVLVSATIIARIMKGDVLSLKNTSPVAVVDLSSVIPGSDDAFISIKELKKIH